VSHNRRVAALAAPVRVYGDPIMRTTVGPLPSSVYWRRRAVVLGAALLGIIVLFVSCSGGDDNGSPRGKSASNSSSLPTPAPADGSAPEDDPSFVSPGSGGGPSLPDPGSLQSQQAGANGTGTGTNGTGTNGTGTNGTGTNGTGTNGTGTNGTGNGSGTNTNVTAPTDGSCADTEMSVTPVPSSTTIQRGASVVLTIKIKNVGSRTCARDVGAGPQELYLDQGARKYWSSDDCNPATTNDVRQFAPGAERDYKITWNGRQSSSCSNGVAAGPNPPDGQFQLRARLGTLVSSPVVLTFVG
jgi:hypothetical protein